MPLTATGIDHNVRELRAMAARAADLTPVWDEVGDTVSDAMHQQFRTAGAFGGKKWAPLKPEYLQWKIRHGYSPETLIKTGTLQSSLISRPMSIEVHEGTSATFGSSVGYFKFHQKGTRYMPMRKVLFWFQPMTRRVQRKLVAYIVDGVTT